MKKYTDGNLQKNSMKTFFLVIEQNPLRQSMQVSCDVKEELSTAKLSTFFQKLNY